MKYKLVISNRLRTQTKILGIFETEIEATLFFENNYNMYNKEEEVYEVLPIKTVHDDILNTNKEILEELKKLTKDKQWEWKP